MRQLILFLYWVINGIFFILLIPIDKIHKVSDEFLYKRLSEIARRSIKITGSKLKVEGLENIKSKNVLIVSNHSSIFDPLLITALIGINHTYVAKKEISKIPILNYWGNRLNALFLDRENMRESMKMIMAAIKNTKEGHNYLIFPEGTRNEVDEEFKSGSLKIAQKAKVNILPITIRNSNDMYEKNKKISKANVFVKVHPEYSFEEYKDKDIVEISQEVEKIVQSYKVEE